MTLALFDSEHIQVTDDNRDSWCTPQEVVDCLVRFAEECETGVIDTDPCSNSRSIVPARTRYTIADDGLSKPWRGLVFVNPPYSDPTPWMLRCATAHIDNGRHVIACIKADPSVKWWSHVWTAKAICFPDHRIDFTPPPGVESSSNNFASALPYWGSKTNAFERCFAPLGKVIRL